MKESFGSVIPAQAGIQGINLFIIWTPAFAGVTTHIQ